MSAHAIFTADNSRIKTAVREIREEIKSLKQEVTSFSFGTSRSGGTTSNDPLVQQSRQRKAAIQEETAELKKQEQANRTRLSELKAEEAQARATAAANKAAAASIAESSAAERQAALQAATRRSETLAETAAIQQQAAVTKANTEAIRQQEAAQRLGAAGSRANVAAAKEMAALQGVASAEAKATREGILAETAAIRQQEAASRANAAAIREQADAQRLSAAESRANIAAIKESSTVQSVQDKEARKAAQDQKQAEKDAVSGTVFDPGAQQAYVKEVETRNAVVRKLNAEKQAANAAAAKEEEEWFARSEAAARKWATAQTVAARQVESARKTQAAAYQRAGLPAPGTENSANINAKSIKQLADETSNAARAGNQATSAFARFRATILAFATGYLVIQGFTRAFDLLKEATIGYNAAIQNTAVSLTHMLGSKQAADDLLASLQQFAVFTPFKFVDLPALTVQLRTAGVAVKDIIPTIQGMGDAAVASGRDINESVNRMALDLISLSARGKVTGQDIRNFGSYGVNIVTYLAQAYSSVLPKGTKQAELAMRDLMHKGLIPADKAIQAISKGMQNDPLKAGLMAKASTTFTGALNNIWDAIQKVFGGATKTQFNALTEWLNGIHKSISSAAFQDLATEKINTFFGVIQAGYGVVAKLYDAIIHPSPMAVAAIGAITAAMIVLRLQAASTAIQLGITAAMSGNMQKVAALQGIASLAAQFTVLKGALQSGGIIGLISQFSEGLVGLLYILPLIVAAVGVAAIAYQSYQKGATEMASANYALNESLRTVDKSLQNASKYAGPSQKSIDAVTKLRDQYDRFKDTPEGIGRILTSDLPEAKRTVHLDTKLDPLSKDVLEAQIDKLKRQLEEERNRLRIKLQVEQDSGWWDGFKTAWSETFNDVNEGAKWLWGQIAFGVVWLYGQVKYGLGVMLGAIWDVLKEAYSGFAEAFSGIWGVVSNFFTNATGGVDGWGAHTIAVVKNVLSAIAGAVSSAWKWVADVATTAGGWIAGTASHFGGWFGGGSLNPGDRGNAPVFTPEQVKENERRHAELLKMGKTAQDRQKKVEEDSKKIKTWNTEHGYSGGGMPHYGKSDMNPEKDKKDSKAENAAKRLAADKAEDQKKYYDNLAKYAEDSAKRQMDSLVGVRDKLRGLFDAAQQDLLKVGIINNPLQPLIDSFERWTKLGPKMKELAANTLAAVNAYKQQSNAYASKVDKLRGGDGLNPPSVKDMKLTGAGAGAGIYNVAIGQLASEINNTAANTKSVRALKYSCAWVAGKVLNTMGEAIKESPVAAQLVKNAKAAGWIAVPGRNAPPGALISMYSGSAPSKTHVGVSAGGGYYVGSSSYRFQRNPIRGDAVGYVPPNGPAGPGALGGLNFGKVTRENQASTLASIFGQQIGTIDAIDGSLSKIKSVPKAWGAAVRETGQTTIQFMAQTMLADKEFQNFLMVLSGGDKKTFDLAISKIRATTKSMDNLRSSAIATAESQKNIRSIDKDRAMIGHEGDTMFAMRYDFAHDPERKGTPANQRQWELFKERGKVVAQINRDTELFVEQQEQQSKVLSAGAPYLKADNASLLEYEHATKLANIQLEAYNALREKLNSTDPQVRQKAQDDMDTRVSAATQQYHEDALSSTTKEIMGQIAASKEQADSLKMTRQLMQENVLSQDQISARVDAENTKRDVQRKLYQALYPLIGRAAAETYALAVAQEMANDAIANAEYAKETERIDRLTQSSMDYTNSLKAQYNLQEIYKRTLGGGAQDREVALAQKDAELQQQITDKKIDNYEALAYYLQFMEKYDAEAYTKSLADYNKVASDAAKQTAIFGDTTGLAGDVYDQSRRSLEGLTGAQREYITERERQNLVDKASILGLQKFGQQYDQAYSQYFSVIGKMDQQRRELGGGLNDQEKQRLSWMYEDLEMQSRIAGMTEEQRQAYLKQKPAVDSLRQSILGLLGMQEQLNYAGEIKAQGRRMTLMMEPDEIKRARKELEYQLEDQGYKDPVVIKAILDADQYYNETQRLISHTHSLMDALQGEFRNSLDTIEKEGFGSFFSSILSGFTNILNDISKQVLAAYFTKVILGWFPQIATAYDQTQNQINAMNAATLASAMSSHVASAAYAEETVALLALAAALTIAKAAGADVGGSGGGSDPWGGGGDDEPVQAAAGIKRVPYHGFKAILHKDEAVLTATDAEDWRGMRQGTLPAKSTGGSSSYHGGNNENNYHTNVNIGTIELPNVREPENFGPELQHRLSRDQNMKKAYNIVVGQGGRKGSR